MQLVGRSAYREIELVLLVGWLVGSGIGEVLFRCWSVQSYLGRNWNAAAWLRRAVDLLLGLLVTVTMPLRMERLLVTVTMPLGMERLLVTVTMP